jgi:hypothetical protein
MHLLDCVRSAPSRTVSIGTGIEVRLEDRLQHQLGGGLHHPVPDRRNAERPLTATGLRDHHPSHRLGPVRLRTQIIPETGKPPFQPCRLDHRERHPVHPGRTLVRACQVVGVTENILAINLVVEQVEAERRFRLRLEIKLPLKPPDVFRCLQARRQLPILVFVESAPEVRALPSAGVTRPHRSYNPVRLPPGPPPIATSEARPPTGTGLPRLPGSPF